MQKLLRTGLFGLVFVLTLILLTSLVYAAPVGKVAPVKQMQPKDPNQRTPQQINDIAEHMLRGEQVAPEDKRIAASAYERLLRNHPAPVQPPSIDMTGGPDAFGYSFIDNQSVGGPTFSWITPSGAATDLSSSVANNGDDGTYGPYTLPFSFPMYGTNYSSFYLGNNGYIDFGGVHTGYTGIPNTGSSYAGIYYLPGDMYMVSGQCVVKTEALTSPTRFLIYIYHISYYTSTQRANYSDAEVVLYPDGHILIQYNAFTAGGSYPNVAGIQPPSAPSPNHYLGYVNYSGLGASRAVLFSPPNGPQIGFTPTNISYGTVVTGSGIQTRTAYVKNAGGSTLHVTNITSTTVGHSPSTMTIAAGDSALLTVTWNPLVGGVLADSVVFTSDAINGPTNKLPVSGSAVSIHNLDYSQDFSSATWPSTDWTISGPGAANWVYDANGNGGANGSANYSFYNYNYDPLYQYNTLWSPPLNTVGVSNSILSFDRWYYTTSTTDTLFLVYSTNGGSTFTVIAAMTGNSGANALYTTSTYSYGYYTYPAETSGYLNSAYALPAGALGQPNVQIGFRVSNNHTGYTSKLTIDNVSIANNINPRIAFNPTNLSFPSIGVGSTYNQTVYVKNVGGGPLHVTNITATTVVPTAPLSFTVAVGDSHAIVVGWTPGSVTTLADNVVFTSDASNGPTNNLAVTGSSVAAIASTGGPDTYGYQYITSANVNGPVYNWITPSGGATDRSAALYGDDSSFGPFTFEGGFSFPFYGTSYTQFYFSDNGHLGFTSATAGYGGIPETSYGPTIDFYPGDMYVRANTVIKTEALTSPSRWVMTLTNYDRYSPAGNFSNIQIILYATGNIVLQYGSVYQDASYPAPIGIQNNIAASYLALPGRPCSFLAVKFYLLGQASVPAPANNATGIPINATLNWNAAAFATGYDVYFDSNPTPTTLVSSNQAGLTYNPGILLGNHQYYWQIVSRSATDTNPGPIWTFTTGVAAAPNAPTAGAFVSSTTATLTGSFTDNATDETGFPVTRSIDGITFNALVTAPAHPGTGTVTLTDITLTANTHYWYEVYATGPGGTSIGAATMNGWTAANIPGAPTSVLNGASGAVIALAASTDPAITTFAIHETSSNQFVQANGHLGASAVWQTATQWGTNTTILGLAPSTTYRFEVKASNGAGAETAYSTPPLNVTTNAAYMLPFNQDFSSATFPPLDWTIDGTNSVTWTYSPNGNGGANGSANYMFYNYLPSNTGYMTLWTPPINTSGLTAGSVFYDRWYYNITPSQIDTLYVVYSLDGGVTSTIIPGATRWSNGTGTNQLWTSSTSTYYYYNFPAEIDGYMNTEVVLPPEALNVSNIRFGFMVPNHMYYGSKLTIDNVSVQNTAGPRIGFVPTNLTLNTMAGTPVSTTAYVKNIGTAPLNITSITATTVVPSPSNMTIAAGDSALLTVTWSPALAGPLADNIVFTSNALNGPTNNIPVTGTATGIHTLPYSEGFTSSTPWPPTEWSIATTGTTYQWQWVSPQWAMIYDYLAPDGQVDHLVSPIFTTVGVAAAEVDFNWSYVPYYSCTDELQMAYTTDGGTTYNLMWHAWGNGTGANDLAAGTGGSYTTPATSNFGAVTIPLPAGALGQPNIRFAFIAISNYGADIFVTNFHVAAISAPVVAFNPASVAFGLHTTGSTYTQTAYVKNVGTVALNISNVTATTVVPSWTSHSAIAVGDSAAITLSWTPGSVGTLSDNVVFTSDAANSPTTLSVSGNAVLVHTLPLNEDFSTLTFPPTDWSIYHTGTGSYEWVRADSGQENLGTSAYIDDYDQPSGDVNWLYTPVYNTTGAPNLHFSYFWSYNDQTAIGSPGFAHDTLEVMYTTDGIVWNSLYINWSTGLNGGDDSTNCWTRPSSSGTWGFNDITMPAGALNQPMVQFAFRAASAYGSSIWIDNVQAHIVYTVPGTPVISIAYNTNTHTSTITWPQPAGMVDGYKIFRETTTGLFNPTAPRLVGTNSGAASTTYIDAGVTGHEYYEVTAFNAGGSSTSSFAISLRPSGNRHLVAPTLPLPSYKHRAITRKEMLRDVRFQQNRGSK